MRRTILAVLTSLALPLTALAELTNPVHTTDLYQFLQNLLRLVAQIGFPIIVLFLVYIGFLFVVNGSKPEELKKTRQYFLFAIIGALLVLGAYALSLAIQATVNEL